MLTLSTCFYNIKSKFDVNTYLCWMDNLLNNVVKFNLVIYTNQESFRYLEKYRSPTIKIILKEFHEFEMYKYKLSIIDHHSKIQSFQNIDWTLLLIWLEKIFFVKQSIAENYFPSSVIGWCDIGYFRCNQENNDISSSEIRMWPNLSKVNMLDVDKIYYAIVVGEQHRYDKLITSFRSDKEIYNISYTQPYQTIGVSGGFFICSVEKLGYWAKLFEETLQHFFDFNIVVRDDQIVILTCIARNPTDFNILTIMDEQNDHWFQFQHFLK